MMSTQDRPASRVTLTVPAHPDLVACVGAMTRSVAVLADLILEQVEDLQMAADEAAILLLPLVDPNGPQLLTTEFEVDPGCVRMLLSVVNHHSVRVDRTGLAWKMLTALEPTAEVRTGDGRIGIAICRPADEVLR